MAPAGDASRIAASGLKNCAIIAASILIGGVVGGGAISFLFPNGDKPAVEQVATSEDARIAEKETAAAHTEPAGGDDPKPLDSENRDDQTQNTFATLNDMQDTPASDERQALPEPSVAEVDADNAIAADPQQADKSMSSVGNSPFGRPNSAAAGSPMETFVVPIKGIFLGGYRPYWHEYLAPFLISNATRHGLLYCLYSPDARVLAGPDMNGTESVRLIEFATGRGLGTFISNGVALVTNTHAFAGQTSEIRVFEIPSKPTIREPRKSSRNSSGGRREKQQGSRQQSQAIRRDSGDLLKPVMRIRPNSTDNGTVKSLSLSPDGRVLAAGFNAPTPIFLFDVTTGRQIANFGGNFGGKTEVFSLAFSQDGETLASLDSAGKLILWDLTSGDPKPRATQNSGPGFSLMYSPDGSLIVSVHNATIRLWDAASGEPVRSLMRPPGKISDTHGECRSIVYCDGGNSVMATYPGRRSAIKWDLKTGQMLTEYRLASAGDREHLVLTPDARYVMAGWKIWDLTVTPTLKDVDIVHAWNDENGNAIDARFIRIEEKHRKPDDVILEGTDGQKIQFPLKRLLPHNHWMIDMIIETRNLKKSVEEYGGSGTASRDDHKKPHKPSGSASPPPVVASTKAVGEAPAQLAEWMKIPIWPTSYRFNADGEKLLLNQKDGSLEVWDLDSKKQVAHWPEAKLRTVGPIGRNIIWTNGSYYVPFFDLNKGHVARIEPYNWSYKPRITFMPDDSVAMTVNIPGDNSELRLVDTKTGATTKRWKGYGMDRLVCTEDGRRLALVESTSKKSQVWLFDGETLEPTPGPEFEKKMRGRLMFTRDGNVLSMWSSSGGRMLTLMDASTGRLLAEPQRWPSTDYFAGRIGDSVIFADKRHSLLHAVSARTGRLEAEMTLKNPLLAIIPDSRTLVFDTKDRPGSVPMGRGYHKDVENVVLYDLLTKKHQPPVPIENDDSTYILPSANGEYLAATEKNREGKWIRVWKLARQ